MRTLSFVSFAVALAWQLSYALAVLSLWRFALGIRVLTVWPRKSWMVSSVLLPLCRFDNCKVKRIIGDSVQEDKFHCFLEGEQALRRTSLNLFRL